MNKLLANYFEALSGQVKYKIFDNFNLRWLGPTMPVLENIYRRLVQDSVWKEWGGSSFDGPFLQFRYYL